MGPRVKPGDDGVVERVSATPNLGGLARCPYAVQPPSITCTWPVV
jgi:hypothetical protein